MRASIMTGLNTLNYVEDATGEEPRAGEVQVRVRWCSACHSDLHVLDGTTPPAGPTILGHEASGVVHAVGLGVVSVEPGDHVVLSIIGPCGTCAQCIRGVPVACVNSGGRGGVFKDGSTRISHQGEQVTRAVRVGAYAEFTVVPEQSVVKIDRDVPLDLASIVGCSVQTGFGAIKNIAQVRAGESVGVIGLGAVGIAAVQAARIAGAVHIIAIDPLESRRELALKLGATTAFSPEHATVEAIREVAGETMLNAVVDTVTKPVTTNQALRSVGFRGRVVVVGVTPPGQDLGLKAADVVLTQKRVLGCYLGNCVPRLEIPQLIDLWRKGVLDLESMVTNRRPLHELDQAFDDLRVGIGLRTAVEVSPA